MDDEKELKQHDPINDPEIVKTIMVSLAAYEKADPQEFGVDKAISVLKLRHQALRRELSMVARPSWCVIS